MRRAVLKNNERFFESISTFCRLRGVWNTIWFELTHITLAHSHTHALIYTTEFICLDRIPAVCGKRTGIDGPSEGWGRCRMRFRLSGCVWQWVFVGVDVVGWKAVVGIWGSWHWNWYEGRHCKAFNISEPTTFSKKWTTRVIYIVIRTTTTAPSVSSLCLID